MYLAMSALRSEADIWAGLQRVCFVPKAVDREFPLKPDPDRFRANPHPRKVNSESISAAVCYEIPNQATSANSGRALRPRRARPANNSFTKFEFNQAWLAES